METQLCLNQGVIWKQLDFWVLWNPVLLFASATPWKKASDAHSRQLLWPFSQWCFQFSTSLGNPNHSQMMLWFQKSPFCLLNLSNELPNLDLTNFLKNSTGCLSRTMVMRRRLMLSRPQHDFEIIPCSCRELFIFPFFPKCFYIHDLIWAFKQFLKLSGEATCSPKRMKFRVH